MVYYKGTHTEVLVDVLLEGKLPAESLQFYKRSAHLQMIYPRKREDPYKSLKHVDPKPLWDFPGHRDIKPEFFKLLLLRDAGEHELIVTATIAEDMQTGRDPFDQYVSGDLVVPAGAHLVSCETGMLWATTPNITTSETLALWPNVENMKLQTA
jgi:hypothetical protein